MSRKTKGNNQTAHFCSGATGTNLRNCRAWEKAKLISDKRVVPDALSRDQRRFEAMIVLVLAKALCDRQLDGALLGFQRVEPTPDSIRLYPHTVMANRVLKELLPRLDDDYDGQLRGVPGLRARWHQGTIVLYDLMTRAEARVNWPRRTPPAAADLESPGRQLWRHDRLDIEEADDRTHWSGEAYNNPRRPFVAETAARDWLLSRALRRIKILNLGASPHGFANTYSHQRDDLVIESCCRTGLAEITKWMSHSKFAERPKDPLLDALEALWPSAGETSLAGRIGVTFRCLADEECKYGEAAEAYIDEQRREWYS